MGLFGSKTGGSVPQQPQNSAGRVTIERFENENRTYTAKLGRFKVMQHKRDLSVGGNDAMVAYFMDKMNVRRRQLVIDLDEACPVVLQAGAMQWMAGSISMGTGLKGAGDFLGKVAKGAVTGESAIKPEYSGRGTVVLEPTYKHIILQEASDWPGGMCVEDGMFLACDASVKQSVVARNSFSSAAAGNVENVGVDGL